jgi:DNA-3-methyladenine glycosylase II
MKRLIPQFGDACLQSRGDAFTRWRAPSSGQQISVKAAQSVWDRFAGLPRAPDAAQRAEAQGGRHARRRPVGAQGRIPGDLALHFRLGQACM